MTMDTGDKNKYSIGDVSSILNISRDMVRYYEKQGVVHARRDSGNNYRCYDTMDVFWLLEAEQHKCWGVPIGDISKIRSDRFINQTADFLGKKYKELEENARYSQLLSDRLKQIWNNIRFGKLNIGNYWVQETAPACSFHLVRGHGDDYERINMPGEASRIVFSGRNFPFFDSSFTVSGDAVDWEMSIEKRFSDALRLGVPEGFSALPSMLCLCTHIDIGEIGHFDQSGFHALRQYAEEHGFTARKDGKIRGILLGRGFEGSSFHRLVRLFLPIQHQEI